MRPYAAALTILALVLLQTTVMPYAALGGVRPQLPLLAVVTWAMLQGVQAGAWWAVGAGLALDVLSASSMGTYALPLLASVAVVGITRRRLHPTNPLLPAAVVVLATIAFALSQRLIIWLHGGFVLWSRDALSQDLALAALLNVLWLPLLYLPLRAAARAMRPTIDWTS